HAGAAVAAAVRRDRAVRRPGRGPRAGPGAGRPGGGVPPADRPAGGDLHPGPRGTGMVLGEVAAARPAPRRGGPRRPGPADQPVAAGPGGGAGRPARPPPRLQPQPPPRTPPPDGGLPHLLVVLDGGPTTGRELLLDPDGLQAVTVLDLDGRTADLVRAHGVELVADDRRLATRVGTTLTPLGTPDALAVPVADCLAQQLAEFRLDVTTAHAEDLATVDQTLPGLLGIAD